MSDIKNNNTRKDYKMWCYYVRRFLICAIFFNCLILYVVFSEIVQKSKPTILHGKQNDQRFYVKTKNCHMPYVNPWSTEAMKLFQSHPDAECAIDRQLVNLTYDESEKYYILSHDLSTVVEFFPSDNINCYYKEISRGIGDDEFEISDNKLIVDETIIANNVDAVVTHCYIFSESRQQEYLLQEDAFSLVQYRESKSNASIEKPNVLLIGIDSLSRFNLRRTMPKTMNFLSENKWYELEGYNKIGDNTFPNLMAILTGYDAAIVEKFCNRNEVGGLDKCNYTWNHYQNAGYRTAYGEDISHLSTFNFLAKGFIKQPTEFYLRPLILAIEKILQYTSESNLKYCVGRKQYSEYIFDFLLQFTEVYKDQSKFGLFWSNSFTHNDHTLPTSMDKKIVDYLNRLKQQGIFNNSIVLFFSDHGTRFGPVTKIPEGFLEQTLPMFFISLPQNFQKQYPNYAQALEINRNRLSSNYDIYMTLKHILELYEPGLKLPSAMSCQKCQSLFYEIPENRTCFDATIPAHYCACLIYEPINNANTNNLLLHITNLTISGLNRYLLHKELNKLCSFLTLKILRYASQSTENSTFPYLNYRLRFDVSPNNMEISTSVIYNSVLKEIKMHIGDINRLNSYENDSLCIDDKLGKLFCACKDTAGTYNGNITDDIINNDYKYNITID